MAVVENLRSKYLYKVLLVVIKYMPLLIALLYAVNTFLCMVHIDIPIMSSIIGVSLSTWVFMLLCNIVFRFCICHRLFLYYILFVDLYSIIEYYFEISVSDGMYVAMHSLAIFLVLVLFLYFHVKDIKRAAGTKDK